jgi:hypothetical protein
MVTETGFPEAVVGTVLSGASQLTTRFTTKLLVPEIREAAREVSLRR